MKKRLFFSNILSIHSQQKRWVSLTMRRIATTLAVVVALLFSAGSAWADHVVNVRMPAQLSIMADLGGGVFNAVCAKCHGTNAAGTDKGPSLIHRIYEPSHHSDLSFVYAVKRGVLAHHWPYGDMPPQFGVSDAEVLGIIEFIREVQRENGIH